MLKEYNEIMERLDFIEFRQQLLFDNDDVSRSIFEYGLTREQYKRIMALMQDYRERIERGESVIVVGLNSNAWNCSRP